jgi:hypothetical protein
VFQDWVIVCPPAKVQASVQLWTAAVPLLVTVTVPWNPPVQLEAVWYVTEHPAVPPEELGETDADAEADAEVEVDVLTEGDAEPEPPGPTPVTWPLPPSKTTSEQP